jgi:argonaute-like protein implicated in RNA metabolism and viral defense
VFLKSLGEGEIPWHLKEALPTQRTLYVGVGYSRYPSKDQEQTSFASITRDDGLQPRWEPLDFPLSPERYFDSVNAEELIGFLSNQVARDPSIERVVVLRHGDVYPAELEAFQEAYEQEERHWDFDFVGLTDTHLRLFERDPEPTNPESGLIYVPDEDRCLLSMSSLPGDTIPEGSVQLLEATRAVGETPIEDIGREIYDQAFLNWGSPAKPPKDPLPVDLAEKMARLATRVSDPRVFEHFPL